MKSATAEDWSGISFANNWRIMKKYNCAEYRRIYQESTGDMNAQIRNVHYLCHNDDCNIDTYIERTTIKRALDSGTLFLSNCKICKHDGKCYYADKCRVKKVYKEIDRSAKVQIGNHFGSWTVTEIIPSGTASDHQSRAFCTCEKCGRKRYIRFDHLQNEEAKCDCIKGSLGEQKVQYALDEIGIEYKREIVFDNFPGHRFDFVIGKDVIIEYDGEGHFIPIAHFGGNEGLEERTRKDREKDIYAAKHGITLIRIPYTDYWKINKEYLLRKIPKL